MQTKTYFASTVPAALEVARKELGEEAMLVNSKPASAAARPYGRLEVTFAYDAKPVTALFPSAPALRQAPVESRKPVSELDEIRQQISALRMEVARPMGRTYDAPRSEPAGQIVADRLVHSGFGRDTAEEIGAAVGSGDGLGRELAARIPVADFAITEKGEGRAIALVGPPGRGKTTTLIKIAVRFGLANRIPVKIYMAGSHGVGCEDQLARYASVLGVPFQPCESLESLTLALNGDMWKGLALIDTPGISPSDAVEIGDFARFFQRRPEIEKHLVLRADARSADISHVITRFSSMEISRLLFTGLDEAVSLGAMADGIIRSRIPAALAGTGQRIPEDLETVSVSSMVRSLQLPVENATAAVAA
jgi:flagellar biosynthesis protein FlhF